MLESNDSFLDVGMQWEGDGVCGLCYLWGWSRGSVRGNLVGITCLSIDMEPAIGDVVSLII